MERVIVPVINGTRYVTPVDEKTFFIPLPEGARRDMFPKDTIEHVYALLNNNYVKMPEKEKIEAEGTVAARKRLKQLIECASGVGRLICVMSNRVWLIFNSFQLINKLSNKNQDTVLSDRKIIVGTAFYVAPGIIATIWSNARFHTYNIVAAVFTTNIHVDGEFDVIHVFLLHY